MRSSIWRSHRLHQTIGLSDLSLPHWDSEMRAPKLTTTRKKRAENANKVCGDGLVSGFTVVGATTLARALPSTPLRSNPRHSSSR